MSQSIHEILTKSVEGLPDEATVWVPAKSLKAVGYQLPENTHPEKVIGISAGELRAAAVPPAPVPEPTPEPELDSEG